ncbi:hypothetical protein CP556_18435 [Natrinema sp. CBA1119]|nr:hypothetical protein CP556_18435 [Natrinema sp. CBA1119]
MWVGCLRERCVLMSFIVVGKGVVSFEHNRSIILFDRDGDITDSISIMQIDTHSVRGYLCANHIATPGNPSDSTHRY